MKFQVALPDGRIATRGSKRTYTHVVIAQVEKWNERGTWVWGAIQWSQKPESAEKAARSFSKSASYRNVQVKEASS